MNPSRLAVSGAALITFAVAAAFPAGLGGTLHPPLDPDHAWAEDTVFAVREVRPGVFFAVGRAGTITGSNSSFIVTDRDVILVDDHITPRAARALLAEIRRVTTLPLRYVVNTHFHYDHTSGNTVFGPDVEIVSHPRTRERLISGGGAAIREQITAAENRLAALRARRDTTTGDSVRALLDRQIASWTAYADDYRSLSINLPTLTVDSSIIFHRAAGQEIRVFYFGRGHTLGDVVVHLPRERLLIAGDMITNTAGTPYMADGYAGEWGATLRRLARLDFTTTLPGHGEPFEGAERYEATAALMDAVWAQARRLARLRLTREAALQRFDLSRHLASFPGLRNGFNPLFAGRALDLAAGRAR